MAGRERSRELLSCVPERKREMSACRQVGVTGPILGCQKCLPSSRIDFSQDVRNPLASVPSEMVNSPVTSMSSHRFLQDLTCRTLTAKWSRTPGIYSHSYRSPV